MALFSISYLSATYIFPNDLLVIILNKCSLDYQDLYMQLPFAGNFGVNCRVNDHVTGHFQGEKSVMDHEFYRHFGGNWETDRFTGQNTLY